MTRVKHWATLSEIIEAESKVILYSAMPLPKPGEAVIGPAPVQKRQKKQKQTGETK